MKTSPTFRRYLVPAVIAAACVASYAFGYITNLVFSDPAAERAAAAQQLAAQNAAANGGSVDPVDRAALARIGGMFADGGAAVGGLTVEKVTGGMPLNDWLKKLLAQDDEAFRLRNFMLLHDALNTPEEIQAALKALSESGGGRGAGRMEAALLLRKLTMLDPKAALAYAAEARGGERMMATSTVLKTWAKTDPDAALAWAKENGAPKEGEGGGRRGPGGNENTMLANVISQIAKTNVDKALAAASTAAGRLGGRTADVLAGEMIEQRGADSARAAASALPDGAFKAELISQMIGKLAGQDPKGTATWASGLAAGQAKSRALQEVVQEWSKKDSAAAGVFIAALPVSADADSARASFAVGVAGKDQNSALATIKGISNPDQQKRTVSEIAGSIGRKDVAAAQQFVAQSSIQDQAKAEITRSLTQPRRGPGGGRGGQASFQGPGGGGMGGRGGRRGGRSGWPLRVAATSLSGVNSQGA